MGLTQCSSQHPPQPLEYYEKALKEFDNDMPVVVFSDSIDWVKEQDLFKPDRFMISEQTDKFSDGALVPYIDLCLMTLCDHAIIANSSMSWWGAWLIQNEYKKVVAPKMWFELLTQTKTQKICIQFKWLYCSYSCNYHKGRETSRI